MKTVKETILRMLTENTGKHFLDSGGAYGRNWQRNQEKDFENEPEVSVEVWNDEVSYSISVFHYLNGAGLEFDSICNEFNKLQENSDNWNADTECYGVSREAWEWLENYNDVSIENTWNTYNGESFLSQVLQGSYLEINGDTYVLFQIHGGCDVRGGYTDAKLFKCDAFQEWLPTETVYGEIDGVQVDNMYDGYSLTDENGQPVTFNKGSKIELDLMTY